MKLYELKSGDLLYWPGEGFYGRLVRFWTRSPYGHVGVFWKNGSNPMLAEATRKNGVVIRDLNGYDPPKWAQHTHSPWTMPSQAHLLSLEGEPYDWWDAIKSGFGLRAGSRGYMCSEFAVKCLRNTGWRFEKGYNNGPGGLAKDVEKASGYSVEPLEL